jgi:ribosome biogenesis protein BMS1
VFGDFEDLETGEQHVAVDPEGDVGEDAEPGNGGGLSAEEEERRLKKLALRARFDAQYNEGSEDAAEEPLDEKEKSKRFGGPSNDSGEKDYFDQVFLLS